MIGFMKTWKWEVRKGKGRYDWSAKTNGADNWFLCLLSPRPWPQPAQPLRFPFTFSFSFALSLLPFLFLFFYDYDFFSLVGGFVLCGKDGWIMCHVSVLDWWVLNCAVEVRGYRIWNFGVCVRGLAGIYGRMDGGKEDWRSFIIYSGTTGCLE
jgi:hypothetical protein